MSTTSKKRVVNERLNGNGAAKADPKQERLPVLKTYKIYIGG